MNKHKLLKQSLQFVKDIDQICMCAKIFRSGFSDSGPR